MDSKSSGRTIPTLRPTSSTKSRGLQFCTTHTLQSHSFMRDCRDCIFGPQMSPSAMYRPYIALIATPAISWRPRPSLVRPRAVSSTPGHALHAGGVGLTRLDRGEKATFWWPRGVACAVPRLVPLASFYAGGLAWSSHRSRPFMCYPVVCVQHAGHVGRHAIPRNLAVRRKLSPASGFRYLRC